MALVSKKNTKPGINIMVQGEAPTIKMTSWSLDGYYDFRRIALS
jgi:hypothetical protein